MIITVNIAHMKADRNFEKSLTIQNECKERKESNEVI